MEPGLPGGGEAGRTGTKKYRPRGRGGKNASFAKGLRLKDITKIRNITKDTADSYGSSPKIRFLRDASMESISDSGQNVNGSLE